MISQVDQCTCQVDFYNRECQQCVDNFASRSQQYYHELRRQLLALKTTQQHEFKLILQQCMTETEPGKLQDPLQSANKPKMGNYMQICRHCAKEYPLQYR